MHVYTPRCAFTLTNVHLPWQLTLVGLRPGMMPNESAVPANSTSEQADLSTKKAFPMFRISEVGLYGEQPGRRGEKGNADQAALWTRGYLFSS